MTEQEINRAIQYVTASTSYAKDTVGDILRTGLQELSILAAQSTRQFERKICWGTCASGRMRRTGHPERWCAKSWTERGAGSTKWRRPWPSRRTRRPSPDGMTSRVLPQPDCCLR
ncbi:MAG: hypothetical protein U0231_13995 [Nitrospiraceae bacterium]